MLRYFIYLSGYFVFSYEVNALPCPVLNGLDSPQPLHGSNKTIPECSVNANGLDGSSIQNITFGILTVCLALASLIMGYLHYRQRDGLLATGTSYSRSDTQLEDTPLPQPELNASSPSNMTPLGGPEFDDLFVHHEHSYRISGGPVYTNTAAASGSIVVNNAVF